MSIRTLVVLVIGLFFLYGFFTYGAPFLLALIIAILLEPFVQLGIKFNKIGRQLAAALVCTLFTLLMLGFTYGAGDKILTETVAFAKTVPAHLEDPDGVIQQVNEQIQDLLAAVSPQLAEQVQSGLGSVLKSLTGVLTGISGYIFALAKSIPNMLISFIVFLLSLYLMSMNLPNMRSSFLSLFEEQTRGKMAMVLVILRKAVIGFIVAQLIMSFITFVLMFAGLLVLRSGYPLAVAFIVTLVDILPILGTGSVLVPWAMYEFVVGDNFMGTGLLILFGIVNVVRRIVEPKILGNAVGIGSLSALISLFIGFKLVGVVGLFIGPVVVILFNAMRQVGLLNINIKIE